jgi:hypothetical protein
VIDPTVRPPCVRWVVHDAELYVSLDDMLLVLAFCAGLREDDAVEGTDLRSLQTNMAEYARIANAQAEVRRRAMGR